MRRSSWEVPGGEGEAVAMATVGDNDGGGARERQRTGEARESERGSRGLVALGGIDSNE